MGRIFYTADRLGSPFDSIREISFVLTANRRLLQRSPLPKIVCFLEGACEVVAGDDFRHQTGPGDLFILPAPCHHYYHSKSRKETRIYAFTVFFHPDTPKRSLSRLRPGPERDFQEISRNLLSRKRHVRQGLTPAVVALISSFRQEQEKALPGREVRLQSLARLLLVELWRQITAESLFAPARLRNKTYAINEVKEFLAKSRDMPVTLAQAAWHVQWSEEHLARTFKKETGVTVMDYLRTLRIDAARLQLLSSSKSISSIANSLRFSSIGNFCRTFKAVTGQTPSQYRERHTG